LNEADSVRRSIMNNADSKAISSIRFPLAVMVMAIHSYFAISGWALSDVKNYGLGCNSAQFFIISISHVIAQIAVPTFFLISGFLFFSHFGDGGSRVWKRKISNRIKTLLVPYLLWILLYIGYSALSGYKTILQDGLVEWLRSVVEWMSYGVAKPGISTELIFGDVL
jgi:peptidoglycan/LPS O-acetylase OafA/YrhL